MLLPDPSLLEIIGEGSLSESEESSAIVLLFGTGLPMSGRDSSATLLLWGLASCLGDGLARITTGTGLPRDSSATVLL